MNIRNKPYFPPLRKNFYRAGQHSVIPENREFFRSPKTSKNSFSSNMKPSNTRNLSVSPRFISFHQELLNKSRVSLINDSKPEKFSLKIPINVIKLHDYELENWRSHLS
jgi:hypothetical protein